MEGLKAVDIYDIVQESLNGKKKKKHAREARLINSSNNITDPVKPSQEANFLFENSTKDELAKALAIPSYTSTAKPKKFELVVETRNLT